jgi:regulator of sigma E protease
MILGAIAAIFVVVLIHEMGHFTVARLCGVKVVKFSIGFGKAICSYTSKKTGTEYAISIIPLGGYVKMYGEQPDQPLEDESLKNKSYSHKPTWQRMAIALAGPAANFILAIVMFLIVYMLGVVYVRPIIGSVVPNSIAAKAGISRGEQIVRIDNKPVYGWQQVMTNLLVRIGNDDKVLVVTQKNGVKQDHYFDLSGWALKERSPDIIHSLGFVREYVKIPPVLQKVMKNSPAERAGLQAGDLITKINGQPVEHWMQILHGLRKLPGKTISMTVRRNGLEKQLTVHVGTVTQNGKPYGHIGAQVKYPEIPPSYLHTIKYGFVDSVTASAQRTWGLIVLNLKILGKMFTGAVSVNTLGGPISVFKTAGQASQAGWSVYLSFIGFVSVALGFINLLPIPMLDGGHVFFQLIEMCTRRPVPMRYQILGLKIGVVVIVWLMVQATVNDIIRLV